jgi:hypothetical protein
LVLEFKAYKAQYTRSDISDLCKYKNQVTNPGSILWV